MAAEIAKALDAELDVILCKKLRAPGNPELALGAVSEGREVFLNADVCDYMDVDQAYLEQEKQRRHAELDAQVKKYRALRLKSPVGGRSVILVDDGLATGATMIASVQSTAAQHPRSIVVAVPGGAADTAEKIRIMSEVDNVICLETPSLFYGVGQLYENFEQVDDDEVIKLLVSATQPR